MPRPNPELFQFDYEAEAFVNCAGEPLTDEMREQAADVQKMAIGSIMMLKVVWP